MIRNMYVKNFVLIDELHLEFHDAFSCFTGETGAGKSLFIDALAILSGARVSSNNIQKGAEKAFIEATIELPSDHPTFVLLKASGYEMEDDYIIVSREFNQAGKSTARINNRMTTVSFLREVMQNVIDIHSQHDSQYLLDNKNHLSLLDSYVNDFVLVEQVNGAYRNYQQLQKELDQILQEHFNLDDLEFYKYQFAEIENLAVAEGEIEELEQMQKDMHAFEAVSKHLKQTLDLLATSKYENLYAVQRELETIEHEIVQNAKEEILNAYYIIEEKTEALKQYANTLEYDEEQFNQVQERLFDIHKLIRKHGLTYQDVANKALELQEKIVHMEERDSIIATKEALINTAYEQFNAIAKTLSDKRKKAAVALEQAVKAELADLHLNNAEFKVVFQRIDGAMGIDQIEFYIAMNKGEDLKPLAKVISGGELSRLMLGLKTIFSRLQHIQTIIFDEIDTGVSGNVAYAIGKKMKKLAVDSQVFAITHLAPVAAWGDYQYLVEKKEQNDRTVSSIKQLNKVERIYELAAIASNSNSEQALQAATELYDSCRSDAT